MSDTKVGIATVLMLAVAVVAGVAPLLPPPALRGDAAQGDFSATRARTHVQAIAARPHPIGSEAHEAVRKYIVGQLGRLGLEARTQETAATTRSRGPVRLVTIRNIVAVLQGARPSKAILLAAHYDSVPASPGASDNGSGVATLLETARALRAKPPLNNDVIFLFTDGEEAGLLGANAFVTADPLASSVGLVLNFDARGSGGPVVLIDASGPRDRLVDTFSATAPYPVATSLSDDVYRRMPNATDFGVFKTAGYQGLSFAFFEQASHYHSRLDTMEYLSERSLQHAGSYALSQTLAFGNTTLPLAGNRDRSVFFNVGRWLLRYSDKWTAPIGVVSVVLWAAIVVIGMRRRALRLSGLVLGGVTVAAALLAAAACGVAVERWMRYATGGRRPAFQTEMLYLGVACSLALLVSVSIFHVASWRVRALEATLSLLGVWTVLSIGVWSVAPGASYLFAWPAVVGLACACVLVTASDQPAFPGAWGRMSLASGTVPALILLTPMIVLIYTAMGPAILVGAAIGVALLVGLCVPALQLVRARAFWPVPVGVGLVSAVLVLLAILTAPTEGQTQIRAASSSFDARIATDARNR